ncbi:MAG TPA: LysE family translocator [Thermoanaerobaculia bacterium]|jgi:threonine/homoserine/homoserine lactone efflux protein
MPESTALIAFVAAALALLITPGPAVVFVVTRSVQLGRKAGVLATLGLTAGGLVHVVASVAGLSAILAASASLFTAVKLIGAGYLIYLGVKTLMGASEPVSPQAEPVRASRLFVDGFVVNVFNPKPALFFLAFLPQFVSPAAGPVQSQLLILGLVFVTLALFTDGAYALAASSMRQWFAQNPRFWRAQRYASGTVYLGLGITAGLTGRASN